MIRKVFHHPHLFHGPEHPHRGMPHEHDHNLHHGAPPPPPHHNPEGHPPSPHHLDNGGAGSRNWYAPLPDEIDLTILEELLQDSDQARAVFRVLTSSPPEVAAVACLVLRQFKHLESIVSDLLTKITTLESFIPNEVSDSGNS